MFGGWIEPHESSRGTILPEVKEELNGALEPSKLSLRESRQIPWGVSPNVISLRTHVYHYPVTAECDRAVLNEDQACQFMQPIDLKDKYVVPHHWAISNDYWRTI